jgi:hypothetical protein
MRLDPARIRAKAAHYLIEAILNRQRYAAGAVALSPEQHPDYQFIPHSHLHGGLTLRIEHGHCKDLCICFIRGGRGLADPAGFLKKVGNGVR